MPTAAAADAAAPAPQTASETLGPNSKVALLEIRLRELGEPIYGTKQERWLRPVKAEARANGSRDQLEQVAARHGLRIAGEAPAEVVGIMPPARPVQSLSRVYI